MPRLRSLALGVGLARLAAMPGADGAQLLAQGAGEWMAVAAGLVAV